MKLILLSKHFIKPAQEALAKFTHKDNSAIKIAFCSNAGDLYKSEEKEYINLARQELEELYYTLIELDLNTPLPQILHLLDSVDAVFFTGGSFQNLMSLFVKSGLDTKYRSLLAAGLIHIGFSAGAMICSKDFSAYAVLKDAAFTDSTSERGLGLFPYYIIPHYYDKPKYTKAFQEVISAGFSNAIPLTNNQAIIVEGEEWQIVQ